jgi:hypothetical protein
MDAVVTPTADAAQNYLVAVDRVIELIRNFRKMYQIMVLIIVKVFCYVVTQFTLLPLWGGSRRSFKAITLNSLYYSWCVGMQPESMV